MHGDVAEGRSADREQLLVGQCIQREQQGWSGDSGDELGRCLQQLTAHWIRNNGIRARIAPTTRGQQNYREKGEHFDMDSTHDAGPLTG
jgi:hypothetical protein